MATLKTVLHSKVSSKGKKDYRLALRVTVNGRRSYTYLGINILLEDWDKEAGRVKETHPKCSKINRLIRKKYDELEDFILEIRSQNTYLTAKQITTSTKQDKKGITFFMLAEDFLSDLIKSGKYNRETNERPKIRVFREFVKQDISFHEIDQALLEKFGVWLISERRVNERTIMNYYMLIRMLYNKAISQGIVEQKYYPFGKGKIKIKYPDTLKIGLCEEEILSIEKLDLEEWSDLWHTRNVFLFSFYLAGMRISDVLRMRWSDFKGNRLFYRMQKNKKVDSLKVPEKVHLILSHYRKDIRTQDDFVFPELKRAKVNDPRDINSKIRTATKKFNDTLAEIAKLANINKKITNHISRHSFGNIAGDKVSPLMLQKLYRHTHLSTTIGYQGNFIHKDADDALDKILGF